jgi:hypothetical protein
MQIDIRQKNLEDEDFSKHQDIIHVLKTNLTDYGVQEFIRYATLC